MSTFVTNVGRKGLVLDSHALPPCNTVTISHIKDIVIGTLGSCPKDTPLEAGCIA